VQHYHILCITKHYLLWIRSLYIAKEVDVMRYLNSQCRHPCRPYQRTPRPGSVPQLLKHQDFQRISIRIKETLTLYTYTDLLSHFTTLVPTSLLFLYHYNPSSYLQYCCLSSLYSPVSSLCAAPLTLFTYFQHHISNMYV